MTEKPYGEVLDEMDHQAKYQPATNQAEANPVTSSTLAEFLHENQPLMLGGRSQPLSVYLEFSRLILSEFNMRRKPPLPRSCEHGELDFEQCGQCRLHRHGQ